MNREQEAIRQAAEEQREQARRPPSTQAIILTLILCTAFITFIVWQTIQQDFTLEHEIHTRVKGILDNYENLDRDQIRRELESIERDTRPRVREHPEG